MFLSESLHLKNSIFVKIFLRSRIINVALNIVNIGTHSVVNKREIRIALFYPLAPSSMPYFISW